MHRGAYQRGLASLTRSGKRFHRLLLPLLYLQPLLLNRSQAATWTRTYSSLIDPFKRAKAGRAWPPKVLKPEGLICDSWFSFSLPNVSNALNELAVFSSLANLTLRHIRLDTNFLPFLLGPGTECREKLKVFCIEHCLPATPSTDYDRTMAFLLEAIELLDDRWKDIDLGALEQFTIERLGLDVEDEEALAEYDQYEEDYETLELARVDYRLFTAVWEGSGAPGCPLLPIYPASNELLSLTSLTLQLTSSEQLYLIIYTSNFPSLRRLILAETDEAQLEVDLSDVETFRMAITRDDPNDPDEKPGLLYLSSWWDDEILSLISAHADGLSLDEEKPVPPLSPAEVEKFTWRTYEGPQLDLFDLREAEMVILLP